MNYIATIIYRILELIYPTKCINCKKVSKKYICKKCLIKLGIKFEIHIDKYKNKNFKKHIYLFKYEGWIREKIIKYKFRNRAYLYRFFSESILEINEKNGFLKEYDYIISVPISKKRRKERGYNQSELIAREIVNNVENIELLSNIIVKNVDNKPQSTLNQKEREKNVKGAYSINENINYKEILNKNILLIDDIYTTGNTVNECARVLKQLGTIKIDILTIAKD